MNRVQLLTAAIVVAVAGGAGVWFGRPAQPPPDLPKNGTSEVVPTDLITVHAAGEVARPGLVEVAVGARVADVIEAAGGFGPEADRTSLNLAAPVVDGQQVVVHPKRLPTSERGDGKVVVNQADGQELEAIPGVGAVLAGRIVTYRDANGPFAVVEDLLSVPGIGEGKLAAMRDYIQVP